MLVYQNHAMPVEEKPHGGDGCELCVLLAKSLLNVSFCSRQKGLRVLSF